MVNIGLRASPVLIAARASSIRPSCAKPAARKKCAIEAFRLFWIDLCSHATDSSSLTEMQLRPAGERHPTVSNRIARAEAERFKDVTFSFLGATEK